MIAVIVFFERAQRRLLIQYPKRQVGNKMFQGDTSHLPLKLNTSGVIPVIFASSLLLLPATIASFAARGDAPQWLQVTAALLGRGQPLYLILFAVLIIFFSFFYTSIVFNPTDTADNLKRSGGFIPGIRPGERTAQHIDYVLTRITVDRRALPDGRGAHPRDDPQPAQRQPVHRRHLAADHGDGDARYHQPDPEPPDRAAV